MSKIKLNMKPIILTSPNIATASTSSSFAFKMNLLMTTGWSRETSAAAPNLWVLIRGTKKIERSKT